MIAAVQAQQPEIALFTMLETLPLANITSFLGVVLIVVFFVTSSDSGSLVIDTITAGGKLDAPVTEGSLRGSGTTASGGNSPDGPGSWPRLASSS